MPTTTTFVTYAMCEKYMANTRTLIFPHRRPATNTCVKRGVGGTCEYTRTHLPTYLYHWVFNSTMCFDCMHTLDLGILQVAIPSSLWDLAAEAVWRGGRSLGAQLTAAYVSHRAWCKRNKIPCAIRQRFKPTIWMKSGYPRISQVTAKTAALRSMLYWISEECDKHVVTEHQQMRAACVRRFLTSTRFARRQAGT